MTESARDAWKIGVAAAIAAVALGMVYMALADAPMRLLLVNGSALGIGLALFMLVKLVAPSMAGARSPLLIALSLVLLATALAGVSSAGASRWLSIGGLIIQPGLILAPILVTAFALRSDRWSVAALALAVIAIALQPDRAVAAMLLAGTGAVALCRRNGTAAVLAGFASLGFAVTLARADALPAMPYVDQIMYTSLDVHPLAGAAVWTGLGLMLFAPLLTSRDSRSEPAVVAFAATWAAAVVAAGLGNYPTPLVGYGASAIIGYLLGLAALPSAARTRETRAAVIKCSGDENDGNLLRFA